MFYPRSSARTSQAARAPRVSPLTYARRRNVWKVCAPRPAKPIARAVPSHAQRPGAAPLSRARGLSSAALPRALRCACGCAPARSEPARPSPSRSAPLTRAPLPLVKRPPLPPLSASPPPPAPPPSPAPPMRASRPQPFRIPPVPPPRARLASTLGSPTQRWLSPRQTPPCRPLPWTTVWHRHCRSPGLGSLSLASSPMEPSTQSCGRRRCWRRCPILLPLPICPPALHWTPC
mmetsp:Transcript_8327/g.21133  ORF Transcript_8327/g.21133 Transcript_8327/m.21133 type:complete len:233 (+) Transcript_8327:127-825(+)